MTFLIEKEKKKIQRKKKNPLDYNFEGG